VNEWLLLGGVFLLVGLVYALWELRSANAEQRAETEARDVAAIGEVVPASLHPYVDPQACIGSGACVAACPEKQVIGVVKGQAQLLNPLACIGHGACEVACPVHAIKLVYGTRTRGVDLPKVDKFFQTNRDGIYIVGELSGMGLIKNAVSQGKQAAERIVRGALERGQAPRRAANGAHDAIVVGAGPAGIATTLSLLEAGLDVLLIERETFGGTIMHYPRAKVVMTGALDIPMYGRVQRRSMSKEELVAVWQDIYQKVRPPLVTEELVERLDRDEDGMWVVHTTGSARRAANVVLALGVRGAPAKLGVPGEDSKKVAYRLLEPDVFEGKHVMVVGGGNSAVETALALSDYGRCASVSLSYRRDKFARCRAENRRRIDEAIAGRQVNFVPSSQVVKVKVDSVRLRSSDGEKSYVNDALIVQIGGTPPSSILKSFGIEIVTKYGER
jgi:thioredoxin reductase/ferredoxin